MHISVYIYIYVERERESERDYYIDTHVYIQASLCGVRPVGAEGSTPSELRSAKKSEYLTPNARDLGVSNS